MVQQVKAGAVDEVIAALDAFMALCKKAGLGKDSLYTIACAKGKAAIASIADRGTLPDELTIKEPAPEMPKKVKAAPKKKKE